LDLYQIHSATLESGVLSAADVLEALAELKAEKGWAIGLSVSGELLQRPFTLHRKAAVQS
jgi:aryl-alcohol dehydrogenase-like predicted oxidoreductase